MEKQRSNPSIVDLKSIQNRTGAVEVSQERSGSTSLPVISWTSVEGTVEERLKEEDSLTTTMSAHLMDGFISVVWSRQEKEVVEGARQ